MADVTSLKCQRGRIKGSMSKALKFAESITTKTSIEEITIRLDKLEELWHAFTTVDDELVLATIPSEFDEFEDKYFSAKVLLRKALNQQLVANPATIDSPSSVDQLNSTMTRFFEQQRNMFDSFSQNSSSNPLEVRLPKINIPTFNGDYKDWPSFKDLFLSSVHQKSSLSNVHKFQYLKSALKEDAALLIKHITITDANYTEAWNKLLSRYDKKKQILTSYIKSFLNQSALTQASSPSLRKLTDTSDELIRGIKSLGPEACTRDPWLIYILLNKCDAEIRQLWAEETADKDLPSFEQLLMFLNKRCDALEAIDSSTRKTTPKHIRTLHAKTPVQCSKCTQHHQLFSCPEFKAMDISSKRRFVAERSLCFNCLSPGHSAKKCKSRFRCHFCNKSHHSSLHSKEVTESDQLNSHHYILSEPSSQKVNPQPCTSKLNPISPALTQGRSLNSTSTNSQLTALSSISHASIGLTILPTALVHVIDSYGLLQTCRILIDSGSTASFIGEHCVQRLGLKRENANIRVTGLGLSTPGSTKGSVSVTICSRFDSTQQISVTALILPRLTSTIPSTAFNIKDWSFLKDYKLADPQFNTPNKIDILLGSDHAFYLLRDRPHILSPEIPVIQNTIFGHILSGNVTTFSDIPPLTSLHVNIDDIDKTLRNLWEIEELPQLQSLYSEEEEYCENLFAST